MMEAVCIANGSINQTSFGGRNSQCVAISACASVYSVLLNRYIFTTEDIDLILASGDALYLQLKPLHLFHENAYLFPEELPTEIKIGNRLALIKEMDGENWIANGLFPDSNLDNYLIRISELEQLLTSRVFGINNNDLTDSYLFTGNSYTVSFWKNDNQFYLFNSHAVDGTNRINLINDDLNKARLFCCSNLNQLSHLLFCSTSQSGAEYSLNKLTFVRELPLPIQPSVVIEDTTDVDASLINEIDLEQQISKFTPVVVLTDFFKINPSLKTNLSFQNYRVLDPFNLLKTPVATPIKEDEIDLEQQISKFTPVVVLTDFFKINPSLKTNLSFQNYRVLDPFHLLKSPVVTPIKKRGRPIKKKRGRKATSDNSHLKAVLKYSKNNPSVNRDAVKKYILQNPEINKKAVKKYTQHNPEVHRDAVKKYTDTNPEIHRTAVIKYTASNPQVNKNAVVKYDKSNRNIDVALRNIGLIAQLSADGLDKINLFSLKQTSLLNSDIYHCPHCRAPLFFEERNRTMWCCGKGAYKVLDLPPLTDSFYSHPSFLSRPRAYNNLFAFSALGVSHGFQNPDSGIYFLKVQGRIYHRVFDLSYTETTNPIGLYIHDGQERETIAEGLNLDSVVVSEILDFLHRVNPLIDCFKRLNREPSDNAHLIFEPTSRRTHGNILGDLPIGREIAAIINTEREPYAPRSIAIWKIGHSRPHQVDIFHPLYESFQFPLLYPQGNTGWHLNRQDNRGIKLSQTKYVRCLLLSESRFSKLGKLSEEWLVDMYGRISEERLRYVSNMQNRPSNDAPRTAPMSEVIDVADINRQLAEDETIQGEGGVIAGRIYLPNTFTGGPRYMKSKYMDSIALVNRIGPPSFFITFTCNPKWSEIVNSTPVGRAPDPLICSRVFNLKLYELLKDIRSGLWFGKCAYIMHVVEFQKRGLPHAHICLRVEGGGPTSSVDIDKFVRADIPQPSEAQGRLRQAVLNHMIHGPCGASGRTDLPCWDSDKQTCVKFFPKIETPVTYTDRRGFIHLRRDSSNEGSITYRRRSIKVSDLWVVPYNAALLLKYDCHLNVEPTTQIGIIKYLFKYINKGPDESRVALISEQKLNDEIEEYVAKRYMGSCDATWRICEFDITARVPTVKQLSVHLEGQQSVFFNPGTESQVARQNRTSDLLTYFCRPLGVDFDSLTYLDFFEKYIVYASRPPRKNVEIIQLSNGRFITRRQRGEVVTRMFWVEPNRGEQYFLRLLLNSHPCRGYQDLIRLGGADCTTFQDAAKAVGIANDDNEYRLSMQEACSFMLGSRLRRFFVLLAAIGAPVASLWDDFKNSLSEDFLHRFPDDVEKSHNLALIAIDRLLRKHGSRLREQGLPDAVDDTTELGRERSEYDAITAREFVDEWLPQLSTDQRKVFSYINSLIRGDDFSNASAIFIDGPAGSGKTLLLNLITSHVRGNLDGVVLCTASSGIAAQNYVGGTTAHSMFKLPLDPVDDLGYWHITNGSQRAELIRNSTLIIYDEAPMAHKYLIHLLDRSLRDLMRTDLIFGGKIIIFAGDFRQIPPVVNNAKSASDIINCSIRSSPLWPKLKLFQLSTAHRCRDDPRFSKFLLDLGSNDLPSRDFRIGHIVQKQVDLSMISYVTKLDDLIDFVFPDPILTESDICASRSILSTHHEGVKEFNDKILTRLPGDILHFYSVDSAVEDDVDSLFLGTDALNEVTRPNVPPYNLTLKINSVCMIMRNLSFSDHLLNGTKVIVVSTSPRLITVRKPLSDTLYLIPRITFKMPIDGRNPIEMCRRQFPLQVCYAMTIHKSQGQTINRVGIDLRSDIFSHGQLYVALGRVRELQFLKILIPENKLRAQGLYTHNVVYPKLLLKSNNDLPSELPDDFSLGSSISIPDAE